MKTKLTKPQAAALTYFLALTDGVPRQRGLRCPQRTVTARLHDAGLLGYVRVPRITYIGSEKHEVTEPHSRITEAGRAALAGCSL